MRSEVRNADLFGARQEGPSQLRKMQIGDLVTYDGAVYVLRGLDPMSVSDRRAELEDPATGERFRAPLSEVEDVPAEPEV